MPDTGVARVEKVTAESGPIDAPADAGTPGGDPSLAPVQSKAHGHGMGATVPQESRAERLTSFAAIDFVVPSGREEEWRFTPIRKIRSLLEQVEPEASLELSTDLPEGVTTRGISLEEARSLGIMPPGDRAAALATTNAAGATLIAIPDDAQLTQPVRINLRGHEIANIAGHLIVTAGRHSKATVILEHAGKANFTELVSIVTGENSNLTVVSLQDWQDGSLHLAQHDLLVGRDAVARHIAVTLGGDVVRLNANVRYAGPGAEAQLLGVYFADAGQHLEQRSFIDHEATHCKSHVEYKGALQGETARTVWVGDVLIRAAAEGTDTYEVNRNLVLTDGARADSVPNLEIETGNIKGAGHAAATGRFDDEQLFYLQTRGIREEDARRLVVRGFFADIIQRIGVPEVQERLMTAIEAELESNMFATTAS